MAETIMPHPEQQMGVAEQQQTPQTLPRGGSQLNVGENERLISALGGGLLALYGLSRPPSGLLLAALGGALVYRGLSGHCPMYQALGVNTADAANSNTVRVEHSVTVQAPAAEAYRFWRNFENLPRFMNHLESVTVLDERRSHWVVKAPAGRKVEWDAEIFLEKPDELIAWRTLPDADVVNAGTVRFRPAPADRGCEITVILEYQPPAGALGVGIAKLLGEEPNQQVRGDLRRFKQMIEAGEIATTKGQPAGAGRAY